MIGTTYHTHLSIRGTLKRGKPEFKRLLKSIVGMTTPEQVQDWLMDELSQGHEAYPIGTCDNFDWKTGCNGHPSETNVEKT